MKLKNRYCNGMIHVIKQGDTLYQISQMYQVPLALLLRSNPYVDVYNLQPGQEICVPTMNRVRELDMPERETPEDDFMSYVTDGETSLGDALKEYDTNMEEFAKISDLSQILLAKDVVLHMPKKV